MEMIQRLRATHAQSAANSAVMSCDWRTTEYADISDHVNGTRQRLQVNVSELPPRLSAYLLAFPTFYGHQGQEW